MLFAVGINPMNPQVRIAKGLYEDTEVIFLSSHRSTLPADPTNSKLVP